MSVYHTPQMENVFLTLCCEAVVYECVCVCVCVCVTGKIRFECAFVATVTEFIRRSLNNVSICPPANACSPWLQLAGLGGSETHPS